MSQDREIITRDTDNASAKNRLDEIERNWHNYDLAKWKSQELFRFRNDSNSQMKAEQLESWLGDEKEMSDALKAYRDTLQISIVDFESNYGKGFSELQPSQRLSLRRIQIEIEREAELENIRNTKERDYEQER